METRAVEAVIGKQMVERRHAERQHGSAPARGARHRLAKRGKVLGAGPGRKEGLFGHICIDSNVPYMFRLSGTSVKRPAADGCGSFSDATPSPL